MKAFTLPQTSSYLAAIEQALTAGSALNDELDATRNTVLPPLRHWRPLDACGSAKTPPLACLQSESFFGI
jgi:hypothetical protein